jgi:hypothetical protein
MAALLLVAIAVCWAVLGTAAITSVIARAATGKGVRSRDLEQAWEHYASSKHYRFRPAVGQWPHARSPRVEGRVGDCDLVIEACSLTIKGTPRPCTRVWAHAALPVPARVVVSSDARLVQGPGVHQLEPMRIGDPWFDHALSVRASSADAACRILPPVVRRDLQRLLTAAYKLALVLQVDESEVSLTWLGEETSPSMLDEACAVVVRACSATTGAASYR